MPRVGPKRRERPRCSLLVINQDDRYQNPAIASSASGSFRFRRRPALVIPGNRLEKFHRPDCVTSLQNGVAAIMRNQTTPSIEETLPWHSLSLPDLLATVETTEAGLSEEEACARLQNFGPNVLPHQPPPMWWQIVLRQFQNPLIYILGVAAIFCVVIGEFSDAAFIAAVLAINAAIGGYQEWRAEQSSRALQKLLHIRAAVLRDGEAREIDAEGLVPGDVVWMESGNRVPSDIRLISTQGLEIDESLLTGESLPVQKDAGWAGEPNTPMGDQQNMAFAGSTVIRGRGRGVIVGTGCRSGVGQLALDVLGAMGSKPPLIVRMERFTRVIAIGILGSVAVIGALGVFVRGYGLVEMFMFSVALAVSAIPEGLPVATTVALAVATTRMARQGVVVRRLAAVEGLGSCTLIASDKTGTLTCNEITVREVRLADGRVFEVTGEGFVPSGVVRGHGEAVSGEAGHALGELGVVAALCNEADLYQRDGTWIWRGDPTDLALLSLAYKLDRHPDHELRSFPKVAEIPFEPERQFAASYHRDGDRTRVFAKGAPERILGMCDWDGEPDRRAVHSAVAEDMAARGYRVLAFAEGVVDSSFAPADTPEGPRRLRWLGLVGMIDPLRPGVRDAVASCHAAGIDVCMITGDHPVTALAIARDLGMADDPRQVVSGADLVEKPREALAELVRNTRVFARVAPRQKLELVQAAQEAGHYVAVTGDGVNDAPALRKANIGVAMGKAGTDVAREAAELVITDDNFATIVAGVEEGRIAYDNVRKVIYLLISTGVAEVLLLGAALLTGLPLPLLPVQIIWLNLVTNGIQDVALAFEAGEGDALRRKPRPPGEPIFNRLMLERTIIGATVMAAVAFGLYFYLVKVEAMEEHSARNLLLMLMVLLENVHVGNCRSETKSAFRMSPLSNPLLLGGVALTQLLHIGMLYLPLGQKLLYTEPLSLKWWLILLGLSTTMLAAMELHKLSWRWRTRSNRS